MACKAMIRKSKDYLIDKEVDESNGVLVFMIFRVINSFNSSISEYIFNESNVNYLLNNKDISETYGGF